MQKLYCATLFWLWPLPSQLNFLTATLEMDFFLKRVLFMLVIEVGNISGHCSHSEMFIPGANGPLSFMMSSKKLNQPSEVPTN